MSSAICPLSGAKRLFAPDSFRRHSHPRHPLQVSLPDIPTFRYAWPISPARARPNLAVRGEANSNTMIPGAISVRIVKHAVISMAMTAPSRSPEKNAPTRIYIATRGMPRRSPCKRPTRARPRPNLQVTYTALILDSGFRRNDGKWE
jgi:hypothetical protein